MTEVSDYNLRPFKVHIPDDEIERTKTLLRMRRLPDDPIHPGITSEDGVQHSWMHEAKRDLLEFDWRAVENKLNSFSQYIVTIEGATVHFIYEKSRSKSAIPLLLLHGYPSSILEFHKVIEPLVNAPDGQQTFDVVIPSLPGVGYSTVSPKPGATVVDDARVYDTLMTRVLGYENYVAQAGDCGAIILRQLQTNHSSTLKLALFQTFLTPRSDDDIDDSLLSPSEQALAERSAEFWKYAEGQFLVQCNQTSTIGLTIYDNPQAYLVWAAIKHVKVLEWGNLPEDMHKAFMDELYSTVLLHHYTGTIHTSLAIYQHSGVKYAVEEWKKNPPSQAPFGIQHFEGAFLLGPQSRIKKHGPMIWYQYHNSGGHFPALSAPQEFVDDCRWFFGGNYWKQLESVSSTHA